MKKYQVFISSTYEDLKKERLAALDVILKFGYIPAGMELFPASVGITVDKIKKAIDESDIFVLILGGMYGSLIPGGTISYIEMEYEYAVETRKMEGCVLVIDDKELDRRAGKNANITASQNITKYNDFKKRVLRAGICRKWEKPDDIKLCIQQSLHEIEKNNTLVGWQRGEPNQIAGDRTFRSKFRGENFEYKICELKKPEVGKLLLTQETFNRGINIIKTAIDSVPGYVAPDIIFGINETGTMIGGFLGYQHNQMMRLGIIRTGPAIEFPDGTRSRREIKFAFPEVKIEDNIRCIALVDSEIKTGDSIKSIVERIQQQYPWQFEIVYIVLVGVIDQAKKRQIDNPGYLMSSDDFGWALSDAADRKYKPDFVAFYIEKPGAEPPGKLR